MLRTGATPPEDRSQKYVSDFLERYVLDSDTDSEGRRIPVIKPSPKAYDESHRYHLIMSYLEFSMWSFFFCFKRFCSRSYKCRLFYKLFASILVTKKEICKRHLASALNATCLSHTCHLTICAKWQKKDYQVYAKWRLYSLFKFGHIKDEIKTVNWRWSQEENCSVQWCTDHTLNYEHFSSIHAVDWT